MGINFERKPPFCNTITYTIKIKILSSYSEDYHDIKIPKKEINYKSSSIAILHSVNTKDDKYYAQAYMEEYKYVRTEEVFILIMILILIVIVVVIVILRNNLFITYK